MANRKEMKWVYHGDETLSTSTDNSVVNFPSTSRGEVGRLMDLPKEDQKNANTEDDMMGNYDDVPSIRDSGYTFEKAMAAMEKHAQQVTKKHGAVELIKKAIQNFEFLDIEVHCENVVFRLHSMVLQCYSTFFQNLKNVVSVELPEGISPEVFMHIYDWMLADSYDLPIDDLVDLHKAAGLLGIKCLSTQCYMCLDNREIFREDTAFDVYRQALRASSDTIVDMMLSRIRKYFLCLLSTREYLNLTLSELLPLLRSNDISVNSEIEIFFAVVRWLNHNYEERKQHLTEVVSCVRFPLIPPWCLVHLNKEAANVEMQRIVKDPEVCRLVNMGLSYITTQVYYQDNPQRFFAFLTKSKMSVPQERRWIYDRACPYHLRSDLRSPELISYERFSSYLISIRSQAKTYWQDIEPLHDDHLGYIFSLRRDGNELIPSPEP